MAIFSERFVHLVGNIISLFSDFVILVMSRFGFKGLIWVLIASVPGLCIHFIFMIKLLFCSVLDIHLLSHSPFKDR